MAILAVLLIIVGTIMMAMSQKAGAMAAQVRKGTIHAVLCQNLDIYADADYTDTQLRG